MDSCCKSVQCQGENHGTKKHRDEMSAHKTTKHEDVSNGRDVDGDRV